MSKESQPRLLTIKDFDLNKITFSEPKINKHSKKNIFVNYDRGTIMLKTPKMYLPNGIKRWDTDPKNISYDLNLSFKGENDQDKNSLEIREFHQKLEMYDTLVKNTIMARSKEWLGKTKVSMELVEEFYNPSVNVPMKDGEPLDFPSSIRTKIERERIGDTENYTGRFLSSKSSKPGVPPPSVIIADESNALLEFNESNYDKVIPRGSYIKGIIQLVYISVGQKISTKWRFVQGKVFKSSQQITSFMLGDSDDDDAPAPVQRKEQVNVVKEESENEDDLVDDPEELGDDPEELGDDPEELVDDPELVDHEIVKELKKVELEPVKPKTRAKRGVQA